MRVDPGGPITRRPVRGTRRDICRTDNGNVLSTPGATTAAAKSDQPTRATAGATATANRLSEYPVGLLSLCHDRTGYIDAHDAPGARAAATRSARPSATRRATSATATTYGLRKHPVATSIRGTYIGGTRGLSGDVAAIAGGRGPSRQSGQTACRTTAAAIAADTLRDHTVGISTLSNHIARIFSRRDAA